MPVNISLKTIGIVVKNMVATLDFYRALGLAIPIDAPAVAKYEFELAGGLVLGFLSEELANLTDPKFVVPLGQSMNLHFECADAAAVDERYAALVRAGYNGYTEPWDAFWGQRFARVMDPDGRVVKLCAETRYSEATRAVRER